MAEPREQQERLASTKGEIQVAWLRPGVLLVRLRGHFDMKLGRFMLDTAARGLGQQSRIQIFCDWGDATGYDSDVRVTFTSWVAAQSQRAKLYMLVTSKIVAMGVSVANLALNGALEVFNNRSVFESRLRNAKAGLPTG